MTCDDHSYCLLPLSDAASCSLGYFKQIMWEAEGETLVLLLHECVLKICLRRPIDGFNKKKKSVRWIERWRVECDCEVKHRIQQNKVNQMLVLQVLKVLYLCPGQSMPVV